MKMKRFQAPAYWTALIASLSMALAAGVDPPQDDVNVRIRRVETGLIPAGSQEAAPATLTGRMAHYKVPGVSMAVINGGRIEWAKAYGVGEAGRIEPATPRTLFQAASISKPVAAVGALRLVEEGALELDEDVNQKLILWKVPENDYIRSKPVTLRGIVSHSAGFTVHGFPGYAENFALPTLIQILDGGKPANTGAIRVDMEPGTRWRYSGGGFCVMQQMITDVTGKAFPAFMRAAVLEKLGMQNSTYEQPLPAKWRSQASSGHREDGSIVKGRYHTYPEMAAAGLWTTPSDLARFAVELQEAWAGKSHRVLSQDTVRQMLSRQFAQSGLGIMIEGEPPTARFLHGGSNRGYRCQLVATVETGQGAVVMTNSDAGAALAAEIIRSVAREYQWPESKGKE